MNGIAGSGLNLTMTSLCCCRTALLEQMKQQNGLQNGHVQTNGHANGDAEHTLDIEVQL